MGGSSKSVFSSIASIIIVVVIVAAIVFVVYCSWDKLEEMVNPDFGVVYNDTTYRGKENGIILPETGQAVFSVKNVSSCTVKVIPNYDFTYTVNGVEHHFEDHEDLTGIFVEQTNVFADYFIIKCTENKYSLENVIQGFYEVDAEVVLPQLAKIYPYRLVVTSNAGEEIWLQFGQGESWSDSGLNQDHVVF